MDHFFWTGFYMLENERLIVGPYQGPVACQELEMGNGVCWAAITRDSAVIVPDVTQFPGGQADQFDELDEMYFNRSFQITTSNLQFFH